MIQMADSKKNKKAKKPAVAKSAAGSNNKIAKNNPKNGMKKQNGKAKSTSAKNTKAVADKKSAVQKKQSVKKDTAPKIKNTVRSIFGAVSDACKKLFALIKKSGRVGIIIGAAILLALVAVIVISVLNRNVAVPDYVKDAQFKGRVEPEAIAFDMDISESQQKALVKATKVKGDTHKFDFFVNDTVIMNEYDDPALIEFGSADSNKCVLVFYLLDKNGNELYRSLGVEPGKQIRSISFFDEIPYGTHEATLAVLGYNPETHKPVGMQTARIKLEIGVD